MAWVAAAVVGSNLIGGLMQSDASRSASNNQLDAERESNAVQQAQFDQLRADQKPYREAGYSALDQLKVLMGLGGDQGAAGYGSLTKAFTPGDLANDPGYQFTLKEGERGLQRQASAAGRNLSGPQLKALQRYGQGLASTTFGDAFNRDQVTKNALFNRLSGISGTGQTATNQVGAAGQAYANNVGENLVGAGNVAAANRVNQANIFSNGLNQTASYFSRNGFGGFGAPVKDVGIDPYGYLGGPSTAGDYSDVRLKTNIRRIGTSPKGYAWYSWDWRDGSGSDEGVLAHEVQAIDPAAVTADADGFLMVNYERV